jgi:predicted RNA binding protein YcfA (HicA-like mRNA interferase family)
MRDKARVSLGAVPRRYKFRELLSALREHDKRFTMITRRGKGSHRMLYHPDIGGRAVSYPLKFHGGNEDIPPGYIGDIIRHFKLPPNVL